MGTLHPNIAPYGDLFFTKDKVELLFACGNDAQFCTLLRAIGLVDRLSMYATNELRLELRQELQIEIQHKVGDFSAIELEEIMNLHKIPFAFIRDLKFVLSSDIGKSMILYQSHDDGFTSRRVATKAFSITEL